MFSLLVSSPFAMIYIDHWMPGEYTVSKENMVLINAMNARCNISHYVVVVLITIESSATLHDIVFKICS